MPFEMRPRLGTVAGYLGLGLDVRDAGTCCPVRGLDLSMRVGGCGLGEGWFGGLGSGTCWLGRRGWRGGRLSFVSRRGGGVA